MRGLLPDSDPPHWLNYLEVDDVDQRLAQILTRLRGFACG
jgi:hypothetical protein